MSKKPSIEERFFDKVTKTDSCWLWTGAITSRGYGSIRVEGKSTSTHRLSYMLFNGEIPDGFVVCHTCDVPACVNPEHLWVGTVSDNVRDMIQKNRHADCLRPQTHCSRGHDFDIYGKTFTTKNGKLKKHCGECKRFTDRNYYHRNKKKNL